VIRKIVAPVDGSAASEHILPHVAELYRAVDADVKLVHVTGTDPLSMKRGREYLESLRERAREILPFAEGVLLSGEPAFEILKYAVVEHADIIALTTRGASPIRRVLFGSTAIDLMRGSQIPLFIARPAWPARSLRRVLTALDASRTAKGVLPMVADLARGAGAAVVLVRILPDQGPGEAARSSLERAAKSLAKKSVRVETVLSPGDPAKGILTAAREKDVDLIALGTHGRRGTDRFFFGSVAESVLLGSDVPLLIRRTVRISKWPKALTQGARQ
jgi:nucleotide-binding universal stress UspA family protein